jgi:hypothetical protein
MAAITFGTVTEDVQWKIHNNITNANTFSDTFQCSSNGVTFIYWECWCVTSTVTAMYVHSMCAFRNDAATYGKMATGGSATPMWQFGTGETTFNASADSDFSSFSSILSFTINSSTGLITCQITNENSAAQSFVCKYRVLSLGP